MNREDIVKALTTKFPNRNWGEIMQRYENDEPIQMAQRIAIQRHM